VLGDLLKVVHLALFRTAVHCRCGAEKREDDQPGFTVEQ